jgi:hypothetical protein
LLLLFFLGFPVVFGQARVRCRGQGWPEATPRRGLGLDADTVRVMLLMPETGGKLLVLLFFLFLGAG